VWVEWSCRSDSRTYPLRSQRWWILQTSIEGALLISHHLSTVHCFKSKCCWLYGLQSANRLTECEFFQTVIVLPKASYVGLTERLPYWTPISFLLKGCDCLAFILFQVCSLCTNRVILPLVPQYEMVASYQRGTCPTTNLASLLSLGTLCAPAYVSAYFRDILRWQITRFATSYFDLTAKAESHLIYKRGFLTLGLIVWS